jgi:hypothetical protein
VNIWKFVETEEREPEPPTYLMRIPIPQRERRMFKAKRNLVPRLE